MHVVVGILCCALLAVLLVEYFVVFLLPRRVKRDPAIARGLAALDVDPVACDRFAPAAGGRRHDARRLRSPGAAHSAGDAQPRRRAVVRGPSLGVFDEPRRSARSRLLARPVLQRRHVRQRVHARGSAQTRSARSSRSPAPPAASACCSSRSGTCRRCFRRSLAGRPRSRGSTREPDRRPCAATLLERSGMHGGWHELNDYLREWEPWAAELMETHLSYPILGYFRSQHINQNWLAALTTVVDAVRLRGRVRAAGVPRRGRACVPRRPPHARGPGVRVHAQARRGRHRAVRGQADARGPARAARAASRARGCTPSPTPKRPNASMSSAGATSHSRWGSPTSSR